jgi:hypothetical protein
MMTATELLALRGVLLERRRALLDRLAVEAAGTGAMIEPGFLRLLADIQTTIDAVDQELAAEAERDAR